MFNFIPVLGSALVLVVLLLSAEYRLKIKLIACALLFPLVGAALFLGWIDYLALSSWLGYLLLFYAWSKTKTKWAKNTIFVLLVIGFIAFAARIVPGFERIVLIEGVLANEAGHKTSLKFSLDKILAGVAVLLFLSSRFRSNELGWLKTLICCALFLIGFYWVAGQSVLTWQTKGPTLELIALMLSNALFTCVPEEAFFRLMLQQPIDSFISKRGFLKSRLSLIAKRKEVQGALTDTATIIITSGIFTLLHIAWVPSLTYLIFVFAAGCFYAWVYQITRSLGAAVAAHFSLNAIHMLLYSYP